jgi:hypothetical protein
MNYIQSITMLFALVFGLNSCNLTSEKNEKSIQKITSENHLLKKENEILKAKLRLKRNLVCNLLDGQTKTANSISSSNNLNFLKEFNGKYAYEVKLFEYPLLRKRIKQLLDKSRFEFLINAWKVENPIEIEDNIFMATACEQHNCYATNFILVVDLSKDVLTVGIREENEVEIYSEDKSQSKRIIDWVNRN